MKYSMGRFYYYLNYKVSEMYANVSRSQIGGGWERRREREQLSNQNNICIDFVMERAADEILIEIVWEA